MAFYARQRLLAAPCGWQSMELATDQLCGLGQVTAPLRLSCHLCEMIVWGGGSLV